MIGALASTWSAVAVMIVKKHATIAATTIARTILYNENDNVSSQNPLTTTAAAIAHRDRHRLHAIGTIFTI